MRHKLLWSLLVCALPSWAGEAPLTLQGQAAYHGLTLPLAVIAQARHADLSDIRVLNARGEPVPHAWVDDTPSTAEEQVNEVPFFQAPAAASAVTASQQGGWIIDLRKVQGTLLELRLSVAAGAHGVYGFAIESSDDLQQWRTQTPAAQLLSLQQQGLRLEHTSFDLSGLRARYLRLRPQVGSPVPPLSGVKVTSVTHYRAAPPVQWSEPLAPTQCTAQYCDYLLPRHLPLDRLEWQLADANTLATVDLLVQREQGEVAASRDHSHRHRLRDHLKGVRHKDAPTTPASLDWTHLQRTTAYWLRLPEGEVRSQALRLDAGAVTQLRVQPQGGMVQLGAKPPLLRIGAPAAMLVFLAREPAPLRLAWGGEPATAMSLAQLMPSRKANDPLPVDTATVVMPAALTPTAAPAAPTSVSASAAPTAPDTSRRLWLWAVLLVALSVMGGMAWVLLRPPKKG